MTQETLPAPLSKRLADLLNLAIAVAAGIFWWDLLADRFDFRGPRQALEDLREQLAERRRFRDSIRQTLEAIDDLPEVEDELEQEDSWNAS